MREQLAQYVELLFAGTTDTDEIRQEILQNSLDRFDDLIAQGKAPEAAYRLTISGIGDINEILNQSQEEVSPAPQVQGVVTPEPETSHTKLLRAIAIALYILCAIPVIFFEEIGLCVTLIMVAVATGILVFIGKDEPETSEENTAAVPCTTSKHESGGRKIVSSIIWMIGLAAYFLLSFGTHAWYITWLIFPMLGCVNGIARGIFDLTEACKK